MPRKIVEEDNLTYSLKISFYALIFLTFGYFVSNIDPESTTQTVISSMIILLSVFVFVVSIIVLSKKKKKTLAIIALIVSGLLLFFLALGMAYIVAQEETTSTYALSEVLSENCLNYCNTYESTFYETALTEDGESLECICTDENDKVLARKVIY